MPDRRLAVLVILPAILAGVCYLIWPGDHTEEAPPVEATYEQARIAYRKNDSAELFRIVRELESRSGNEQHLPILRAALLIKSRDFEGALRVVGRPEFESSAFACVLRAEIFYRSKQFLAAEAAARRALEIDPEDVDAHRWLAAIYHDLGADGAAVFHLKRVIILAPEDYRPYHLLGQIQFDSEEYLAAIESYRSAIGRRPPSASLADINNHLAQSLIKVHRYRDALQIIGDRPENPGLMALAAEALWSAGEKQDAKRLLKLAAAMAPHDRSVQSLKSRIAFESGAPRDALEPLLSLLKTDPHDFESRYRLALCYNKLGQTAKYEAEIALMNESRDLRRRLTDLSNQAVREPGNAEIRIEIAELFDKLGKSEQAAIYRQAANALR